MPDKPPPESLGTWSNDRRLDLALLLIAIGGFVAALILALSGAFA